MLASMSMFSKYLYQVIMSFSKPMESLLSGWRVLKTLARA